MNDCILPYAPLVERCIELKLTIAANEFEALAAQFMQELSVALSLPDHKATEHWLVQISKRKNSPPLPKAWLYNVVSIEAPERSCRKGASGKAVSVKTVKLFPPTEDSPSKILFSQCKPTTDNAIASYSEARAELSIILENFEKTFGSQKLDCISLYYWNNLKLISDPQFVIGDTYLAGKMLKLFANDVLNEAESLQDKNLISPMNVNLSWGISGNEANARKRVEVQLNTDDILWTIFAFEEVKIESKRTSSLILDALDCGHSVINAMFLKHFTEDALNYCRYGTTDSTQRATS